MHTETGTEGAAGGSLWVCATGRRCSRGFGCHSHTRDKVPACKHKPDDFSLIENFHSEKIKHAGKQKCVTSHCFEHQISAKINLSVPWEGQNPQRVAGRRDQCSCSCTFFQAPSGTPHIRHTTHSAGPQPDTRTTEKQWYFCGIWPFYLCVLVCIQNIVFQKNVLNIMSILTDFINHVWTRTSSNQQIQR